MPQVQVRRLSSTTRFRRVACCRYLSCSALTNYRRALATSQYLLGHTPNSIDNDQSIEPPPTKSRDCAHYFLDPLSWMRPELEQGKLEGRLECPKCHTNVGKYAWQGMQCSCGEWVVPGISLSKGRIDEARKSTVGIRQPPGAASGLTQTTGYSKENL
jgi:dual specificity phosphatase 12